MNYKLISLIIIAIFLIYFLITYNKFVKFKNNVKEAFSTMDVYLKKRWDLIPNLVETVKGYTEHENNTLKEIIALRSGEYDKLSKDEKLNTNEQINDNIPKLIIFAEKYPDLKANENFQKLSDELRSIEDEIAQSRKYFNAVVRDYNNLVEMVPSNIIAKLLGYKKEKMYMIEEKERQSVKVEV